jgi:hypothetical protein
MVLPLLDGTVLGVQRVDGALTLSGVQLPQSHFILQAGGCFLLAAVALAAYDEKPVRAREIIPP